VSLLIVDSWKTLALRGAVGVLLGCIPLIWPSIALSGLIVLFATFAVVDGITLIASAANVRGLRNVWSLALEGLVGVLVGTITFFWTGMGLLLFVNIVALWALLTGVLELVLAFSLRGRVPGARYLGIAGAASIVFGALIIGWPSVSVFIVMSLLGCYAITAGVSMLGFALRLRKIERALHREVSGAQVSHSRG
jgi:uncharacterized membrane protein HdeD (DUF308 family)